MEQKGFLVLENGDVFEGRRFGADGEAAGELVFTTGMTDYIETLSDPAYYGQIVMQTFPLIGNCGFIAADMQSAGAYMRGYVVREWCEAPSNFRMEGTLDAFLKAQHIPGLYGLDTRAVTKVLREEGVMRARIANEAAPWAPDGHKSSLAQDAVAAAGSAHVGHYAAQGEARHHVVMLDYGVRKATIDALVQHGCAVEALPFDTPASEVLSYRPDGILLSSGPGAPQQNLALVAEIKKLIGKAPLCGIGLGHQLLALAVGGSTCKLKYGHRGANQPVRDLQAGKVYMTNQNHGYAVEGDSLLKLGGQLRMVHVNDNSCEGVDYPDFGAFSVQFYPEGFPGAWDALYQRFINLMGGHTHAAG